MHHNTLIRYGGPDPAATIDRTSRGRLEMKLKGRDDLLPVSTVVACECDHSAGQGDAQFMVTDAGLRDFRSSGDLGMQTSFGIDGPLSG